MLTENISNSYMTIITLLSFIIFYIVFKISKTTTFNFILDRDLKKPQAFHKNFIPRAGGLASIVCLIIFFFTFNYIFDLPTNDYIFFSLSFFILGFVDDIKVNIKPIIRLILMILILLIGLNIFDIKITKTGLGFLNSWLENSYFQYFFLILCFLFIINGSNLIDGFNGLLAIHLIIINIFLAYIHLSNNNIDFSLFLTGQIFIMFCFLLFNFPTAKMFMGDGGAYLFGVITSLNVITASILYSQISPLYFVVLLFYLFFEVFFSFLRKLRLKKSPLRPDSQHLHMLVFKYFSRIKEIKAPNPTASLSINSIYFMSIIPPTILRDDGLFCRYWFLIQLFAYILIYFKFYNFTKKTN